MDKNLARMIAAIPSEKAALFYKVFNSTRKAKTIILLDANDCGLLLELHDIITDTDKQCLKDFGVSLRSEIESDIKQKIKAKIKK